MSTEGVAPPKPRKTYEAGCHCGYIKFAVTLSPPLPETKPLNCDCSACRRFGYLLVYPLREEVTWHGDSWSRLSTYQFNTKAKNQMFCGKCGASIGINFRDVQPRFGISVRTFNGIDLATLEYRSLNGLVKVAPAEDLSGTQYEIDEKEEAGKQKHEDEREVAAAAETA